MLLSLAAFDGVNVVEAMHADASPCIDAAPCGGTTSGAMVPVRRRVAIAPTKKVRRFVFSPSATRRPTPKLSAPTIPPKPTTCAGVAAGVAWPAGWSVQCDGPRAGLLGATEPGGITSLFVRTGETMSLLRVVALHEAGHAWDFARLDPTRIAQWCAVRGCDANRFFSGGVSSEGWAEPSGAEDWASAWDSCHGGEYHRSYLGLDPPRPSDCALQNTLVSYPG